MKICIPTETDEGLQARVSNHFGRAPWFTFWEPETGDLRAVANTTCDRDGCGHRHRHRGSTHGEPAPPHGRGHGNGRALLTLLLREQADTVVCRHLGRGASVRLQEAGIEVRTSRARRVSEIAQEAAPDGSV